MLCVCLHWWWSCWTHTHKGRHRHTAASWRTHQHLSPLLPPFLRPNHTTKTTATAMTTTTARRRIAAAPRHVILLLLASLLPLCQGWFPRLSQSPSSSSRPPASRRARGLVQCMQGGGGPGGVGRVGDRYSWTENDWELEVTVPVPPETRKEDVLFKAAATSLKLGLVNSTELLLGGKLKGRIALDGTYWSLEGFGPERAVKLLLEKKEGALENSMDWRRVLAEEAATETQYQEAEKFDTREYVHQMLGPGGVNMSLVDKEMFGGLAGGVMGNVSRETLREYVAAKVLDDASGLGVSKAKKEEEEEEEEEGDVDNQ